MIGSECSLVWSRSSGCRLARAGHAAVRLLPGQWVRWQLNYRFTSALGIRGWSYWLDTFNIAYGPVDRDVFLSEPTVIVDECGPVR